MVGQPPEDQDKYPGIVEDPLYTAECAKLATGNLPRLDDQLRSVIWAISQNPYRFPIVPDTDLRRVKTREWPNAPRLLIFFTVEDKGLRTLRWIEPDIEPEES